MSLRKTQGAILCPGCRRLIDADEPRCPHCGVLRPGLFGFGHAISSLFSGKRDLTALLVVALVALYGATLALDPGGIGAFGLLTLLAPSTEALYTFGMTGGQAHALGFHSTVLSAMFLHGGLLHLGFNVAWLRTLGPLVAEELGAARMVLAFVITGALAFAAGNAWAGFAGPGPAPTIGASGAIFGLLGVLLMFGRRRGGAWGRALAKKMAIWALVGAGAGFVLPNVNNAAHVAGLVAGLLLGLLLPRREGTRQGAAVQLAAVAALLACAGAILLSIARMYPLMFAGP